MLPSLMQLASKAKVFMDAQLLDSNLCSNACTVRPLPVIAPLLRALHAMEVMFGSDFANLPELYDDNYGRNSSDWPLPTELARALLARTWGAALLQFIDNDVKDLHHRVDLLERFEEIQSHHELERQREMIRKAEARAQIAGGTLSALAEDAFEDDVIDTGTLDEAESLQEVGEKSLRGINVQQERQALEARYQQVLSRWQHLRNLACGERDTDAYTQITQLIEMQISHPLLQRSGEKFTLAKLLPHLRLTPVQGQDAAGPHWPAYANWSVETNVQHDGYLSYAQQMLATESTSYPLVSVTPSAVMLTSEMSNPASQLSQHLKDTEREMTALRQTAQQLATAGRFEDSTNQATAAGSEEVDRHQQDNGDVDDEADIGFLAEADDHFDRHVQHLGLSERGTVDSWPVPRKLFETVLAENGLTRSDMRCRRRVLSILKWLLTFNPLNTIPNLHKQLESGASAGTGSSTLQQVSGHYTRTATIDVTCAPEIKLRADGTCDPVALSTILAQPRFSRTLWIVTPSQVRAVNVVGEVYTPSIVASRSTLDFGRCVTDSPTTRRLFITNNCSFPIRFNASTNHIAFTVAQPRTGVLAPGASHELTVRLLSSRPLNTRALVDAANKSIAKAQQLSPDTNFSALVTPAALAAAGAPTLIVQTHSEALPPAYVSLDALCTSYLLDTELLKPIDFGPVMVGASATIARTLRNTTDNDVHVSLQPDASLAPHVNAGAVVLRAGDMDLLIRRSEHRVATIGFSPRGEGEVKGELVLSTKSGPFTIPFSGYGAIPRLAVVDSPLEIDFGATSPAFPMCRKITLRNVCPLPLQLDCQWRHVIVAGTPGHSPTALPIRRKGGANAHEEKMRFSWALSAEAAMLNPQQVCTLTVVYSPLSLTPETAVDQANATNTPTGGSVNSLEERAAAFVGLSTYGAYLLSADPSTLSPVELQERESLLIKQREREAFEQHLESRQQALQARVRFSSSGTSSGTAGASSSAATTNTMSLSAAQMAGNLDRASYTEVSTHDSAQLIVRHAGWGEPLVQFTLQGRPGTLALNFSTRTLQFGNVPRNATRSQSVTVANDGDVSVQLKFVVNESATSLPNGKIPEAGGALKLTVPSPLSLAPGESATFNVHIRVMRRGRVELGFYAVLLHHYNESHRWNFCAVAKGDDIVLAPASLLALKSEVLPCTRPVELFTNFHMEAVLRPVAHVAQPGIRHLTQPIEPVNNPPSIESILAVPAALGPNVLRGFRRWYQGREAYRLTRDQQNSTFHLTSQSTTSKTFRLNAAQTSDSHASPQTDDQSSEAWSRLTKMLSSDNK